MPTVSQAQQSMLALAAAGRKVAFPEQGPRPGKDVHDHRVPPSLTAAQEWYAGAVAELQTLVITTVVAGLESAVASVIALTRATNPPAPVASAEALCLDAVHYLESTAKTLTAAQVLPDQAAPKASSQPAPAVAK
jgi:hypothetical protein